MKNEIENNQENKPEKRTCKNSGAATCYVVVARRWGGSETHHYIVNSAAFFDIEEAKALASVEDVNRGGKYECTVETLRVDESAIDALRILLR